MSRLDQASLNIKIDIDKVLYMPSFRIKKTDGKQDTDKEPEYMFGDCPHCKIPLEKSTQCPKCHKLAILKINYDFAEIKYAPARTNNCECDHCLSVKLMLIYGDDEADVWGPEDPRFLKVMGKNPFEDQKSNDEKSLDDQLTERIAADIFDETDHVKLHPLDKIHFKKFPERTKLTDKKLACSVCLEDIIKDQKLIKLPCLHRYHTQCLFDWFKYQDWCPYCHQSPLKNVKKI